METEIIDSYQIQLKETLETELNFGKLVKKCDVNGGIVNKATIFHTLDKNTTVFVKFSERENSLEMFQSEMHSLLDIKNTNTIRVPRPLKVMKHPEKGAIFAMECFEKLIKMESKWSDLGEKLSRLHLDNPKKLQTLNSKQQYITTSKTDLDDELPIKQFGYKYAKYFGPIFNIPGDVWSDSWPEYFIRYMLKPQFDEIENNFKCSKLREIWSHLELKISKIYDDTVFIPSLTHGDLCLINIGEVDNEAVLFDPMSSYMPLESDSTIIEMENNFDEQFFNEYWKNVSGFVPSKNFQLRKKIDRLFAYLLISNVPNENSLLEQAIKLSNDILSNI